MRDRLDELQHRHQTFVEERDWEEFHTPKSLAMAISIEANELMEQFQWHDNLAATAYEQSEEVEAVVEEELADVLIYCLSMAAEFDIDIGEAVDQKLKENQQRFDADTSERIRSNLDQWKTRSSADDE